MANLQMPIGIKGSYNFAIENFNKLNARNIAIAEFNNKENAGNSNSLIPNYLRKSNAER